MKTLWAFLLSVFGLQAQTPAPWLNEGTAHTVYVKHKAAHAVAGMAVAYTGAKLGYPKTGIALAWAAGIGKELYDQKHGGSFRTGDVLWTGAPATVFSYTFKW